LKQPFENPAVAAPPPEFWNGGTFKSFGQFTRHVKFGVGIAFALQD
jgi:hypothetical protein